MDPDSLAALLLTALLLIAANAYFVAAEFALLSLRRSRVELGHLDGDRTASRALRALDRLGELSFVAQLGSSAATLALGWVAALLAVRLHAPASYAVALGIAGAALAHAVLGAQIPKLAAMQGAAPIPLAPLRVLALALRPLTLPVQWGWRRVAGSMSLSSHGHPLPAHTPDEIRHLVTQGHEQGVVEEDEREMIHGVFEFTETIAREVMTPRIDVVAVPVDISLRDLLECVVREGHSRLPVYEGTIDTVVGLVLAKDLLRVLGAPPRARGAFEVRQIMREPYFVPDTKPVDDILAEFREQSVHFAVVVDEFGGTAGVVTMEDLLEEIVGEINDEYDVAEPEFAATPEGDVLIDGGAAISEVNERYGLEIPEEDYDTIGGYVFGVLGRVPASGDVVHGVGAGQEVALQVEEIEDRRVVRVRLVRAAPLDGAAVEPRVA